MLDPTVTYHNKNIMTLLKVCHVISRNGFEQWETALSEMQEEEE